MVRYATGAGAAEAAAEVERRWSRVTMGRDGAPSAPAHYRASAFVACPTASSAGRAAGRSAICASLTCIRIDSSS